MPNKQSTTNSQLPDRLYGEHYPDSFLDVPRPVRSTSVRSLGDYIQQLREVGNESDQRDKSCESHQSSESDFQHICPNNPILTCNCTDPKFCAEQPNDNGWIKCPDSGRICSIVDCPDGCKGDSTRTDDKCPNHDGFSDNLEYTGIPYPSAKGKDTVSGWPCVVVGGYNEASVDAAERVFGTPDSSGFAK